MVIFSMTKILTELHGLLIYNTVASRVMEARQGFVLMIMVCGIFS